MIYPDALSVKGALGFASGAAQPITGAAPQVVNGNPVNCSDVDRGTLAAHFTTKVTTNTLTLTGKWQGKDKAGNWIDVGNGPQNAAGVAFQTGTGVAVTQTRILAAPEAVTSFSQARFVITSGVGVGGGAGVDEVQLLDYYWRKPAFF